MNKQNRVMIWNGGPVSKELGGGTRNNTTFDCEFELGLLSEEVKEFYVAAAKNDLVEMIDAACDVRFVYEGIEFKYGMIEYDRTSPLEFCSLEANMEVFEQITKYYNHHVRVIQEVLTSFLEKQTPMVMEAAYSKVCEANEQKMTAKDSTGKTMKGPLWKNPNNDIKQILHKFKVTLPEKLEYVEPVKVVDDI